MLSCRDHPSNLPAGRSEARNTPSNICRGKIGLKLHVELRDAPCVQVPIASQLHLEQHFTAAFYSRQDGSCKAGQELG